MNYRVFTDTDPPRFLASFDKEIPLRPRPGDIITIGRSLTPYVIVRERDSDFENFVQIISEDELKLITEESSELNPIFIETEESDLLGVNDGFDYFVEIQNTSRQSTSLRLSNDNIQQKFERFGY